ncbi:MAG: DUF2088 domain-containing protein [bacterium]
MAEAVTDELRASGVKVRPGERIAVAVGSRGMADLPVLVSQTVAWIKVQGGVPFIVPAMGSHGGATAEGQAAVLARYGITEESVGAPVRSSMDVVELPRGESDTPVYFDRLASESDGTILINRIKPHTSFHGRYESGLMKMMAVGLGKHAQALAIHALGVEGLREVMPEVGRQILHHANVRLGLGTVENAYEEIMLVRALPAADIPGEEPLLLEVARRNMPRLPVGKVDVLVVDEIGKNISGLGMDPNIIGRLKIRGQPEPEWPDIRMIVIRDLTPETDGNAAGMGLADIITRRAYDKIDFQTTYANVLTTGFLERAKVPVVAATDREAVELACRSAGVRREEEVRLIRIRNTLRLDELQVSAAVLEEIKDHAGVTLLGEITPVWDRNGGMGEFSA